MLRSDLPVAWQLLVLHLDLAANAAGARGDY